MEHLQRFYWSRFREAIQMIRHGRLEDGIDTCLELLHEPELNLHIRVLANVAVAEYGSFERHPNKADFAEEAIKVAGEAREDTVGEGPRAQATVERITWLANRSLEIVIEQTEQRNARLAIDAELEEEAARRDRREQRQDNTPITPRLVTKQPSPPSDPDTPMRSSPPEQENMEDVETPRAIEQQSSQASDVSMSSSPIRPRTRPSSLAYGAPSGTIGDDGNTSGSDIDLPTMRLPLLPKGKPLPTPEASDAVIPRSDPPSGPSSDKID